MEQRQADLSECKVSLIYKASARTSRTVTQRKPCLEVGGNILEAFFLS